MRSFHELATPVGRLKFVKQKRNSCSELFGFSAEQPIWLRNRIILLDSSYLFAIATLLLLLLVIQLREMCQSSFLWWYLRDICHALGRLPKYLFFIFLFTFRSPFKKSMSEGGPSGNRQINGYVHCVVIRTFVWGGILEDNSIFKSNHCFEGPVAGHGIPL